MSDQLRIALIGLCGIAAAIGLVVLVVYLIKKQHDKTRFVSLPEQGLDAVDRIFRAYAVLNFCKVLRDYSFTYRAKSCHIDHLLIGEFGILAVDALPYRGELYGTEKDAEWTHYMGDQKEFVPNATAKLADSIAALRGRLGQEKAFGMRIVSFPVVLDKKLELFLPDTLAPVRATRLKARLNTQEFVKKGKEDPARLFSLLTAAADSCKEG